MTDRHTAKDVQPETRHQRIAHAAYLRAAARGFVGGDPMQDWLEAEREIAQSEDGGGTESSDTALPPGDSAEPQPG